MDDMSSIAIDLAQASTEDHGEALKRIVVFLLSWFWALSALNAGEDVSRVDATASPRSLLMVWHGSSEVGFLRAELWRRERADFPHELVIASVGEGTRIVYVGAVVSIPHQLKTDPPVTQIFVRSPADIRTQQARETPIIAAMSPEGILRVYGFAFRAFTMPCDLKPVSN